MRTHDKLFDCFTDGLFELKKMHATIQRMLIAATHNPKLSQASAEIQKTIEVIEHTLFVKVKDELDKPNNRSYFTK